MQIWRELLFVWLYRLFPSLLWSRGHTSSPRRSCAGHRSGFRRATGAGQSRRRARPACGACRDPRSDPSIEPRHTRFGAHRRIHGELLKLGIDIAAADGRQVAYPGRRHRPSPGWRAFLAQSHRPHRCGSDFVRRSDDRVQASRRVGDPASGAATTRLDRCDHKSNRRSWIASHRSPKRSHGTRHPAISSETETRRMVPRSRADYEPWAFATRPITSTLAVAERSC